MMKVAPASAATKKAYAEILEALGADDGAMFGMPCMKADGKTFLGLFGDALVFKLGGTAHTKALALKGAALFDPSGSGRAMKEWVVVPKPHAKEWPTLASAARSYVASGSSTKAPAKQAAAAKKSASRGTRT